MPNLFSESIIDEIRDKCNIAEIIAQYIPLKKAGRNYRALCPFHKEKTPSFMVSPEKGIFHCFGCGAGGNVFNFVMKYEGLEFPQVVRMLAKKTNVKLPAPMFAREKEDTRDLFEINRIAASWYQSNLKKDIGRPALDYLKKRAYQAATVIQFNLGFAPSNNGLLKFMTARGVQKELLEKAGLILRREDGSYHDHFKQRIIFPIFDSRGRILGFGGRVLDNSLPKYVNSPETLIYSKGNHLYGLNFAKEGIKKEECCIIVEGYIDLITAYQNGITNVVASLGTALTPRQIRLLRRYTHNVVMVFDADQAGEMASLRSLDLLIEEEINVKMVSLPEKEDPDSFIRKFGQDKFRQKINQALDLFDYKLNLLSKNYDLKTVEGRVGIASHMLPTIKRIQNAIRRSGYIKRLAQEFSKGERSLGEEWILAELKKVKSDFQYYQEQIQEKTKFLVSRPAEEMLLKIVLEEEVAVSEVREHLSVEDFQDLRIREAIRVIYRFHANGEHICPDRLISCLQSESAAQIISRICSCDSKFFDRNRCLHDCIMRIKTDNFKDKLNRLQREIKLAQAWGHKDKLRELISKYNQLLKIKGEEKWQTKREVARKAE